ncbi:M23 family metallopeptidase [Bacteroidota bacterium]
MVKVKYQFNTKSLKIEKVNVSWKERLLRFLYTALAVVVFSTVIVFLAFSFIDSPKEKMLKREIEQYNLQYTILNDRMDNIMAVMKDLQDRDDNVYRVIFEAEPIPSAVREAGYGGVDKYEKLKGYKNAVIVTETTKKLDKLARQMYVQSKSLDEIFQLAKNKEKMMAAIPAILPLAKGKGRIVSGFGMRFHPILRYKRMHWGIDISAPRGTPIYATGAGVVTFNKRKSGFGNTCIIDHGYSYETLYGHMNKVIVRQGQKVKRGDIIGYVGSTGLSKAPHVHYEVHKNGSPIDPVNFFYKDLTPEEYEEVLEIAAQDNQVLS